MKCQLNSRLIYINFKSNIKNKRAFSTTPLNRRMTTELNNARDIFKKLQSIPSITSAQVIRSDKGIIHLLQNQTHQERKLRSKLFRTLYFDEGGVYSSIASELTDVVDQVVSSDGRYQAIQRSIDDKSNGSKILYLDIIDLEQGSRVHSINVSGVHGSFCSDSTFGRLRWSPDAKAVVYVADRKPLKNGKEDESPLSKYNYVPSWGETFSPDLQLPRLFYLDLENGNPSPVEVATELDDSFSLGQPQFGPTKNDLIFTAYADQPDGKRLGIIFCQNRLSSIFHLNVTSNTLKQLNDKNSELAVRSPRFFKTEDDKNLIVYLISNDLRAHASSCILKVINLDDELKGINKDSQISHKYLQDSNNRNLNIFIDQLPYEPFYTENDRNGHTWVFATTIQDNVKKIAAFNISVVEQWNISKYLDVDEKITNSEPRDCSWDYLGINDRHIVISKSNFNEPSNLKIYSIDDLIANYESHAPVMNLKYTYSCNQIVNLLRDKTKVWFDHATKSWIFRPNHDKPTKGILLPHGGPHAAMTPTFSPALATFVLSGDYTIIMPNYRGSLGYDDKYVESLLGKIGEYDVEDCLNAIIKAENDQLVQRDQWCAYGGSHGGYLAAWLTSIYSHKFKTAIIRNPVINLASNATQSDIPDWNYHEAGLSYSLKKGEAIQTPSPEEYKHMLVMSPLTLAHEVEAPTLLMGGADDQRVPSGQIRAWYHALKNYDKNVQLLVFKNTGHALDSVEAETVGFESTLQWFEKYF